MKQETKGKLKALVALPVYAGTCAALAMALFPEEPMIWKVMLLIIMMIELFVVLILCFED